MQLKLFSKEDRTKVRAFEIIRDKKGKQIGSLELDIDTIEQNADGNFIQETPHFTNFFAKGNVVFIYE